MCGDAALVDDACRQGLVTHGHPRSQVCCAMYCVWARRTLAGLPVDLGWADAVGILFGNAPERAGIYLGPQFWVSHLPFLPVCAKTGRVLQVPVIKHDKGVCSLYVHAKADLDMAMKLVVNAKCQRPGVCNAIENLLVDAAIAPLRQVAPNAGSYVSESNYFNANWAQAFWGANYPKLRAVKAKYDPDGLFIVHHGVGSEGWSDDGFVRHA